MAAGIASTNKQLDRLVAWVCAGLVLGISYLLVATVFFALDPQVSAIAPTLYNDEANEVASNSAANAALKPSVKPSAIPLWNLFGKVDVKRPVVAAVKDVVAPQTRLQLVLMSVFASEEEERSTAIISEKRKPGKLFHVGDKLPGNATLAAVYEDKVLLSRRGKLETLYFPQSTTINSSSSSRSTLSRSKKPRSAKRSRSSRGSRSSGISRMMRGGAISQKKIASVIGEDLERDAVGALKDLGLAQNAGNGYKISKGSNPLFSALGLKAGDVVLSVNGMSIGDPAYDIKAIPEALQSAGSNCTIGIQKADGRQFSQTFPCGGL